MSERPDAAEEQPKEPALAQKETEQDPSASPNLQVTDAADSVGPVTDPHVADEHLEIVDQATPSPDASSLSAANASSSLEAEEEEQRRIARREQADAAILAQSRRLTRRSFVLAMGGLAAGYGFYSYLDNAPADGMLPKPLRKTVEFNAALSREIFREHALAPTYPLHRAENLRVNGVYGLRQPLNAATWRLQLVGMRGALDHPRYVSDVTAWDYQYTDDQGRHQDQGHDTKVDPKLESSAKMAPAALLARAQADEHHTGRKPRGFGEAGESTSTLRPGTPGLLLTMEDLLKLPRHELVTQFKCIEGWSQIVHWAGIRMADFLEAYPPQALYGKEPPYVYMETPDGDYYTGYDLDALRHPQTLLVTEMMGAPLTQTHGAPLRLHMPTKYGYKQIKRIGLIAYTHDKPDDYWTKLGYDWYAGL